MADPHQTVALVTGANKGIGYEIARQLAQQGVTVLLGSRNRDNGLEAAAALQKEDLDVSGIVVDLVDRETVRQAARQIFDSFGKLDILVNNAGISIERGVKPSDSDVALMRETYETNVFGTV